MHRIAKKTVVIKSSIGDLTIPPANADEKNDGSEREFSKRLAGNPTL